MSNIQMNLMNTKCKHTITHYTQKSTKYNTFSMEDFSVLSLATKAP